MKKKYALIAVLIWSLSMSSMVFAAEDGQVMEEISTEALVETEWADVYTWGDSVNITRDELLEKICTVLESISSMKSELAMDMNFAISMEGEASDKGIQMDMSINADMKKEEIFEPYAAHWTESETMNMMGQSGGEVYETYVREENGERVSYRGKQVDCSVSEWTREVGDKDDVGNPFLDIDELFANIPKITLEEKKAVSQDGGEFYVLKGVLSLEEESGEEGFANYLRELLNELAASLGEGSIQLPESVSIDIYVSAEDFLPAELFLDMSGLNGTSKESSDGVEFVMNMEFTVLTVRYSCTDYNELTEIVFPDNLSSAEMAEPDPETEGEPMEESETVTIEGGLAAELGVAGIQETADTSVTFTANGGEENPAGMNELGKVYLYNTNSDMYEQAGLQVTGIVGGEEAAKYVEELLNREDSYYSFEALRQDEEYRIVNYDLYLTKDMTDSEYGLYCPNSMMEVMGDNGDWLKYKDNSYYAPVYNLYEDENEYHPGDTAHCQLIIIMPKELTQYVLKFGPYGMESFNVAIK